jgi:hypothetical protein
MVGVAKSQALRRQIFRKEVDDLKAYAVRLYKEEQGWPLAPGEKHKSSRQICMDASKSDTHFAETGQHIPLAHNTLAWHATGGILIRNGLD